MNRTHKARLPEDVAQLVANKLWHMTNGHIELVNEAHVEFATKWVHVHLVADTIDWIKYIARGIR